MKGSIKTAVRKIAAKAALGTAKQACGAASHWDCYHGRYVFLDTTAGNSSKRVVYAHLSSFEDFSTNNYSSEGFPGFGMTPTYTVIGTKDVDKNAVLGKTGTSGQSTGNHLHFEVRKNATLTREDPFLYVVFPKITRA